MMEKKGVSLKAPEKGKKEDKKDQKDEKKDGDLIVNPNNVMVGLAQTGSKSEFFDLVKESQEDTMPQT